MEFLYIIGSISFFSWIAYNILTWVSLWQVKEYRFDRLFVHLSETRQGRFLLFSPLSILKWLLLVFFIFFFANSQYLELYYLLIVALYAWEGLFAFKKFATQQIRLPDFTAKAIFICVATLFVVVTFFIVPLTDHFLWLLILDKISALIITLFVLLLIIPSTLYKEWIIEKAIKKRNNYKNLLVIGITGSYGKSSTKEYLEQILKVKYNVVKTPSSYNTPIGISKVILSKLTRRTNIFIVEMAMYKKGEIAEMSQMVKPKIGIITAVGMQHMSLAKTSTTILNAKYELIEALPKDGLALFNGTSENAHLLYSRTRKKKVLYKIGKNTPVESADISAYKIKVLKNAVHFSVTNNDQILDLITPLIGGHNVENIIPGIYIAKHLGLTNSDIKKAVAKLQTFPQTMQKVESVNGAVVINDTFNANPQAVRAALAYMKIYKGKKVLVMQPMIELGNEANSEHYKLAKEISTVCDYLLLTNHNFNKAIVKGIDDGNGKCFVRVGKTKEMAQFIKDNVGEEDVVLFEGKEAAYIMKELY